MKGIEAQTTQTRGFFKRLLRTLFVVLLLGPFLGPLFTPHLGGAPLYSQVADDVAEDGAEKPAADSSAVPNGEQGEAQGPEPEETRSEFEILLDRELEGRDAPEPEPQPTSWGAQIVKTLVVLLVIILFFYSLWKFTDFRKRFPNASSEVVRTLHSYPLTPDKSIQIVELGNKLLVLGVSDAGIQLVTEFTEKAAIDRIKLDCDKDNDNEKPDFWVELSKTISKSVKDAVSGGGGKGEGFTDFLQGQRQGKSQGKRKGQKRGQSDVQNGALPNWDKLRRGAKENLDKIKSGKDIFKNMQGYDE